MNYVTPEEKGLDSKYILQYIQRLEEKGLSTHNVILMRGDDIIFEKYWEPFHRDDLHRMYSVTKSFVALAIGFLEQDGLVQLDDPISKYFPKELEHQQDENMRNQTIRHMLMMSTAKSIRIWFDEKPKDRVQFYFENDKTESRPSGTIYQYDSEGSFVLGALVERLTGMTLVEYLREKLFDKIGVSQEAYCLTCPGGYSWGDSALICKPTDLLKVARFVLNKGKWNGEQILNEAFVTAATSKQIDNSMLGINDYRSQGYGYLIWRTYQDSFSFNGMGCQFAICVPHKDLILIYNGDNQGYDVARYYIFDYFFDIIVNNMQDEKVEPNVIEQSRLEEYCKGLKLNTAVGERHSEWVEKINGVSYRVDENAMGITKIRLTFHGDRGFLEYTNEQGDKKLAFGMNENVYGLFPQEGYSNQVGSVATQGFFLKCAASAAWLEPHKLYIKVQVIDTYFGKLNIFLSYQEDKVGIHMNKAAEDFLNEYTGYAVGWRE